MRGLAHGSSLGPAPALGLLLALAGGAGCASKQTVSLACVPREVTVYVDGRVLEGSPEDLSLRKDRPHTVFFKGGGYNTQMVVLESREVDGEPVLSPADLCKQVVFAEMQPEVRVELEESGPEAAR
jgi:hypothetical protein